MRSGKPIILILVSCLLFQLNIYSQNNQARFYMGYSKSSFQEVDPLDATAAIAVYIENTKNTLQKKLNKPVDFGYLIFTSFDDMKKAFKQNDVDLVSLSVAEFYELKKDFPIYPYLAIRLTDNIFDQYCLLTQNDNSINSIKDLSDKVLSMPKPQDHVLMEEWLTVELFESKLNAPNKTFNKIKIVKKESNAVYDVFFKQADCAIIRKSVFNTLCELNPQLKRTLRIIKTSEPIILIFSAASERSDQNILQSYLLQTILQSNSSEFGNILKIFKAQSFAKVTEADLRSSKVIVDKYNSLLKGTLLKSKVKQK